MLEVLRIRNRRFDAVRFPGSWPARDHVLAAAARACRTKGQVDVAGITAPGGEDCDRIERRPVVKTLMTTV